MNATLPVYRHTVVAMDTLITVEVVAAESAAVRAAVDQALGWFDAVERPCSRFDPASEVWQLARRPGQSVPVSPLLYDVLQFALAVAEASDGAFDPAVGALLEARGFNRNYRTGQAVVSGIAATEPVSYRDIVLDPVRRTVRLRRPLLLELGAVAKGLAVDLAARELAAFANFAIDAGGDLYLAGRNASDEPWSVGIQHPREPDALLTTLRVSDMAVCTSGDYLRRQPDRPGAHHLLDPRAREAAHAVASATVVAPTALVADALSTAAFILGPEAGVQLLAAQGVAGLIVTPALKWQTTADFSRFCKWPS
jgi:thiamine biosynthesis lipoprotein